jgi:hypothetical protein
MNTTTSSSLDPSKDLSKPVLISSDISDEKQEQLQDDDDESIKMTKAQILRNVIVLSLGMMCLFTAFNSIAILQSSLNKDDNVGTGGLAIVYGALMISCMFVPTFVIAHLGCKWTIAASMVTYIVYMAANFHAAWWTIAPASVVIGLGAAPLWSAKCTYLTETGKWYAKMTGATADDVTNRFFGIFFMIYQTGK